MAEEERGGVQNVWLLLIALGLGLIVVVIYNVHIYKVRVEGRGQTIRLLAVTREMEPGDKLASDDLVVKPVPKQWEKSLGNVVGAENLKFAVGQKVNKTVLKDQWLEWDHITTVDRNTPATDLSKGKVAVTVPMDSKKALGDILRQNDRVNICGKFAVGEELKTFRIIEGVRVVGIGGEGLKPTTGIRRNVKPQEGMRTYRSIQIEVSSAVSLELDNVLTHKVGDCWAELLSSEEDKSSKYGRINPDLKPYAEKPSGPIRGSSDYE